MFQKPSKDVARKEFRQVSASTSEDGKTGLTLGAAVLGTGNLVPTYFVFAQIHFKDHFIKDGPISCKCVNLVG